MIYLYLFLVFFQIGLFGFGGGYGMLSLIQGEVVHNHHWLTTSEFTDIVAISQMTPGPIGINTATYCGYTAARNAGYGNLMGIVGSATATTALVLPSLILMIVISRMFLRYMNTPAVHAMFLGLRPAVVGLLAAASLLLMTPENFSRPGINAWQFWVSVGLFVVTFVCTYFLKISPIKMIIFAALAGWLLLPDTVCAQERPPMRMPDVPATTPMVHDPVMAYSDGVYHLFSTGRGIQHATSEDGVEWEVSRQPVMSVVPKWTHDSVEGFRDHVWAPDIIRYGDRWWMAYSCSTFGVNTSAIGLLSARRLDEGTIWEDEGPIICSREGRDTWNAIDPNFAVDEEGNPWMAWGSFWDGIQLARLDETMHIKEGERHKTIARRYAGERTDPEDKENPIEAPFIFRHGDYYYLFVSWDYCCRGMRSDYKVVVGRSKHIDGPYADKEGTPMTDGGGSLVIEGDKKETQAAGHCAVYTIDGTDYFICHGYSVEYDGMPILIKRQVRWTDDGWPEL